MPAFLAPLLGALGRSALSGGGGAMAAQAAGQAAGQAAAGTAQNALHNLTHPLQAVTGLVQKFHSSLSTLEAPFKALEGLFGHAANYVAKLSPVKVEYMTRAIDDFQAAIGKQLIPVVEAGTKVFRVLGDWIATVGPKFAPIIKTASDAILSIVKTLVEMHLVLMENRDVLMLLIPQFYLLGEALMFVLKNIRPLLYAAAGATAGSIVPGAGTLIGAGVGYAYGSGDAKKPGNDARGMAFHQAQTETVSSLLTRVQTEAFGYGTGGEKPEVKTATTVEQIWTWLSTGQWATTMASAVFGNAGKDIVNSSAQQVTEAATDPEAALRRLAGLVGRNVWGFPV